MNKATLLTLPSLLATLLTPVISCGEEFLLYTPKPAEGGQAPASPDEGVLVRSVTVKRGDTLSDLSRKYLGKGGWYPQLLLFNSIKNPDLIYTGDKLLVPVPPGQAAAAEPQAAPAKKHVRGGKHGKRHRAHRLGAARHAAVAKPETAKPEAAKPEVMPKPVTRESDKPEPKPESLRREVKPKAGKRERVKSEIPRAAKPEKSSLRPITTDEQGRYQQAKLAYLNSDYQKALELFTDFRSKYPNSTFSADVALYQADCLLHLSGE